MKFQVCTDLHTWNSGIIMETFRIIKNCVKFWSNIDNLLRFEENGYKKLKMGWQKLWEKLVIFSPEN